MTVISETMEITEDRRSRLDLESPDDLPIGKAESRLTVNPLRPIPAHKPFEGLFGVLKNKKSFDGDGVDSRRRWRDEWPERNTKYLLDAKVREFA